MNNRISLISQKFGPWLQFAANFMAIEIIREMYERNKIMMVVGVIMCGAECTQTFGRIL